MRMTPFFCPSVCPSSLANIVTYHRPTYRCLSVSCWRPVNDTGFSFGPSRKIPFFPLFRMMWIARNKLLPARLRSLCQGKVDSERKSTKWNGMIINFLLYSTSSYTRTKRVPKEKKRGRHIYSVACSTQREGKKCKIPRFFKRSLWKVPKHSYTFSGLFLLDKQFLFQTGEYR